MRTTLFLLLTLLSMLGSAGSAGARSLAADPGQDARSQRRELQELEDRAREMRAAGKASGREWRALVRSIEGLANGGATRALWWLLEDQVATGDVARRSRLTERRKLWERLFSSGRRDPWLARSHCLSSFVEEAEGLGRAWALAQLDELTQKGEVDALRAAASIHRALVLAPLDPRGRTVTQAERREAAELLRGVQAAFPGDAELAGRALWRLEHLCVGETAPDFRSKDLFGNEIRLADGRGKVVLLHFFGFGAPDIEQALERDRGLVARYWDDRFWLIGVNEDLFRSRFEQSFTEAEIDWDVAWEGEREREHTTARQWHLEPRAHTFVLDARGVIRAVDPPPAELGKILDELVAETASEAAGRKRAKNATEDAHEGDPKDDPQGDGEQDPASPSSGTRSPSQPRR